MRSDLNSVFASPAPLFPLLLKTIFSDVTLLFSSIDRCMLRLCCRVDVRLKSLYQFSPMTSTPLSYMDL